MTRGCRAVVTPGRTYSRVVLFGFRELPETAREEIRRLCEGYLTFAGARFYVTVPAQSARAFADELVAIGKESVAEERVTRRAARAAL